MNRKAIIAAILLLSGMIQVSAGGKGRPAKERDYTRFTFGVESSYMLTFLNFSHFNFISADGDRRDEKILTPGLTSNGQILLGCGVNITGKWNLSLYTGYSGIYRDEGLIPLTVRATWLSGKDSMKDRWLVFADAGTGFNDLGNPGSLSFTGKLGGGYRITLNRVVKLDFLVAFQESYTHPKAYESDAGSYVPAERLRRNDAYITALTMGIALVF